MGTQRQGSKILRGVVDMKKVSEVLMGKSVKGLGGKEKDFVVNTVIYWVPVLEDPGLSWRFQKGFNYSSPGRR